MMLNLELPYPPSINHYYLHTSNSVILGAKGKKYRRDAILLLRKYKGHFDVSKKLHVVINVFPPDKRKRDLDNLTKCLLDSLQHAGIYVDDNQIDWLSIIRRNQIPNGSVQIWISELECEL